MRECRQTFHSRINERHLIEIRLEASNALNHASFYTGPNYGFGNQAGAPEARFNIDLKAAGAVPALPAFLAEREAWDRVCVGSFSGRRLRDFRRLTGGRVVTSASPGEVAAYKHLPSPVARLVTRGQPRVLQVPHRTGRLTIVTARLVRRVHRAGLHVHIWTIDDPDEMNELLARGVDGLMTDRTDILRAVLTQSGRWRTR